MADLEAEDARLQLAAETAVQIVDGCEHASVTMVHGDSFVTRAASDPRAENADLLQQELGEGPCLDAIRTQQTVVGDDLAGDQRWSRWGPRAAGELGFASTASLWLTVEDGYSGTLNLYSSRPDGLLADGLATAELLAGRLGVGIAAGRDADELNAVGTRTVIGQAQGILMERLGIDPAEAFGLLRRAAEDIDRTLAEVAVELVRTRRLPSASPQQ